MSKLSLCFASYQAVLIKTDLSPLSPAGTSTFQSHAYSVRPRIRQKITVTNARNGDGSMRNDESSPAVLQFGSLRRFGYLHSRSASHHICGPPGVSLSTHRGPFVKNKASAATN